jgi:hypothetical protein
MMGNLMSDCQELVYRGFVPVPEDLDELGDSDPVAKYSNSSKYVLYHLSPYMFVTNKSNSLPLLSIYMFVF